jgi:hypothetical protein
MIKVREEESSEEFEIVQTEEEQNKVQEKKEIQAEATLTELVHMLKDAEENEDVLYEQEQRIALMLEELDKPRLEELERAEPGRPKARFILDVFVTCIVLMEPVKSCWFAYSTCQRNCCHELSQMCFVFLCTFVFQP